MCPRFQGFPFCVFAVLSFFFAILAQSALAQVPRPAHVVVVIEENHGIRRSWVRRKGPLHQHPGNAGGLVHKDRMPSPIIQPELPRSVSRARRRGSRDDSCPHTSPRNLWKAR